MKTLVFGLLWLGPLMAQDVKVPSLTPWRISVAALSGANVLDIASSRGGYELNPILGRGSFGTRQIAAKSVLIAAPVLVEWLVLRHHPDKAKWFVWANFIGAGSTMVGPVHNWRQ